MTDWHWNFYFIPSSHWNFMGQNGKKQRSEYVVEVLLGTLSLKMVSPKTSLRKMFRNVFIDVDSVNLGNRQFHLLYSNLVTKWTKEVPFEKEGVEREEGGSGGRGREGGEERKKKSSRWGAGGAHHDAIHARVCTPFVIIKIGKGALTPFGVQSGQIN